MELKLAPISVLKFLGIIIGLLLTANLAVVVFREITGHDNVYGLVPMFDLNGEQNIPTLYATLSLLLCSVLLLSIGLRHKNTLTPWVAWLLLSLIFALMALDELAALHERINNPIYESENLPSYFHFAWVIPYGIALVVVGLLYVPFLLRLPKTTRFLFITSGIIFVSGALGLELLEGNRIESHGMDFKYFLLTTCEELLEMCGIALFIYALLDYSTKSFGQISLRISDN